MIVQEGLLNKYITIFMVVVGYWTVSILTVFVNKKLLSGINLNAPMFIAFYQTVITAFICLLKKYASKRWPHKVSFPEVDLFNRHNIYSILPVAFMFTMMIAMNNLCLEYVSLAFYYVGRSLTIIFNVLLAYVILKEKTSVQCLLCCVVVIVGFLLGVDQEKLGDSFSLAGTIFGVLASFFLSMFSILTKKVLPKVNHDVWALSYYNNVYSSILFIPLVFLNGEFNAIINYKNIGYYGFWLSMTVGGICGFSVGFFTSLQIKFTSALTHNISGTAKACAQTVLAAYWFQETKSFLWWLSNIIVLLGSATYARIKQMDMERSHRQKNFTYQKV